jgi:hypothetical protein
MRHYPDNGNYPRLIHRSLRVLPPPRREKLAGPGAGGYSGFVHTFFEKTSPVKHKATRYTHATQGKKSSFRRSEGWWTGVLQHPDTVYAFIICIYSRFLHLLVS